MRYRTLRCFDVHVSRYVDAAQSGDRAAADAALHACEQIATESHIGAARFVVQLMHAGRALALNRIDELERIVATLEPAILEAETSSQHSACRSYAAALLEARGELGLLATVDLDAELSLPNSPARYTLLSIVGRARLYALTGRHERARSLLASIPEAELESMPAQFGDLGILSSLADVALALDDRTRIAWLRERLAPFSDQRALLPTFEERGALTDVLARLA
jgi:hypothetical protein